MLRLGWILLSLWIVTIQAQQEKIIGGQQLQDTRYFPYQVSLGLVYNAPRSEAERKRQPEKTKIDAHFCGGVLVDELWVVTAAHCVVDSKTKRAYPANALGIGLGTDLVEIYEKGRIPASRIFFPPEYNPANFYHDVAVIQLSRPVSQVFKQYGFACLGSVTPKRRATAWYSAIGWGNTQKFSTDQTTNSWGPISYSRYLQHIYMKDESATAAPCPNRPDVICAMGSKTNTAPCRGDSGGPLIAEQKVVVGLTSYGDGRQINRNSIQYCHGDAKYARLEPALGWIQRAIGKSICTRVLN